MTVDRNFVMPGLVPGIHVLILRTERRRGWPFFIIFVDGIFTTSLQRAFTNVFDASARNAAIACVYRAGNAD